MLLPIFTVLTGMGLATQTTINSRLRGVVGSPFLASAISFTVDTLFLFVIAMTSGQNLWISYEFSQSVPLWVWIGGLFVFGATLSASILGTGQTVILALFGLICGSLIVDQFGLFGASRKPIIPIQILGIIVLFIGIAFIRLV